MNGFQPPFKQPGDPLPADEWNDLVSAVVTEITGDGHSILASKRGNSVTLSSIAEASASTGTGFWARVKSSVSLADNRWTYTLVRSEPDLAGAFKDLDGSPEVTAYNTIEANNGATGVQGSGQNVDDFASGVSIQPAGDGAVVWVRPDVDCDGNTIYLFTFENAAGGSCA